MNSTICCIGVFYDGSYVAKAQNYFCSKQKGWLYFTPFHKLIEHFIEKEDLVYIDQSGMDNRDIYEYGWGLKGQRIYGQRPGKRRERISMMSGYHLGKLVAPFTWIGIAKHAKVDIDMDPRA